ncbi:large subunit ribosomal protein L21 [Aminicella lysinilytica]|uniref:Large ribosomal subunit protein bL21 n=1 Tax=Aminicella lysinilytica TaxID=433323 RepID=A0A4R6PZP9_9FIRM|nr:large subunit ribosomal protein L21 [Aminicella lysinilytica]
MYAVIETGGKQYRVQEGDIITIEKLDAEAGKKVEFDKVLVLSDDNGLKVGTPYVEGAKVVGKVVENGKGQKIVIFKYKNKKDYRKKQGHRQPYTMVEINDLGGVEKKPAKKAEPKKEAEPKAAPKKEAEPKAEAPKKEASKKVSASMKKDELIAFAKEHNVEIDEKATKAVIIEAIEKATK